MLLAFCCSVLELLAACWKFFSFFLFACICLPAVDSSWRLVFITFLYFLVSILIPWAVEIYITHMDIGVLSRAQRGSSGTLPFPMLVSCSPQHDTSHFSMSEPHPCFPQLYMLSSCLMWAPQQGFVGLFKGAVILCVFFWVIPRRLIYICRRFGTLYLFHLHRQVWSDTRVWRKV